MTYISWAYSLPTWVDRKVVLRGLMQTTDKVGYMTWINNIVSESKENHA